MDINYYKSKYEPIGGEWYIKEQLGKGSYGSVYKIEKEDMSGTYEAALKIITIPQSDAEIEKVRSMYGDDKSVTSYFKDLTTKLVSEFKLMSQLKGNTNIVSYEDHSIFQHDDGVGYDVLIRMELLKPLNKAVEMLSEQDVIRLGIDICKALEICQKYNIVHRDIKPENIFVSRNGDYKLGDFGVAKTMDNDMTYMTASGTYIYMAPELKKGEMSGTNVDIYSLGMVLYKLLNYNREPFLPIPPAMFTFNDREQALVRRMRGEDLPKPANASDRLSEIILKACAYNSKMRYESPLQMRMELETLITAPKVERYYVNTPTGVYDFDVNEEIPEKYFKIEKDEEQETTGIFDNPKVSEVKENKSEEKLTPAESSPKTVEEYSVRLKKIKSNMYRGIDIYVDGELKLQNAIADMQEIKVPRGRHEIKLVLSQTNGLLKAVDKGNSLFGAKNSLILYVDKERDIAYRLNNATGGIEEYIPSDKPQKSKIIALILAIFPYTGLFGVHDFYLGKKGSGFLKLFTLNFMAFGWIIDIIVILIGKYTTKDGDYLK